MSILSEGDSDERGEAENEVDIVESILFAAETDDSEVLIAE
jgi:hypothetical protein